MPLFFFAMPGFYILAVYILAAVLPAWFLLRYIYRHDTVEKEPAGLLAEPSPARERRMARTSCSMASS